MSGIRWTMKGFRQNGACKGRGHICLPGKMGRQGRRLHARGVQSDASLGMFSQSPATNLKEQCLAEDLPFPSAKTEFCHHRTLSTSELRMLFRSCLKLASWDCDESTFRFPRPPFFLRSSVICFLSFLRFFSPLFFCFRPFSFLFFSFPFPPCFFFSFFLSFFFYLSLLFFSLTFPSFLH